MTVLGSSKTESPTARAEWGGGLEFLMSCIATSVGLGNIWRFPFTAYQNGGGAFLIPYIIILLVVGKPFYYLEAILGQFTGKSCTGVWSMSPAMKGVGYGQLITALCVVSYYASLMALTIFYLIASCQSELPWSYCREEWGANCIDSAGARNLSTLPGNATTQTSAEIYFLKVVLNEIDSIENGLGLPSWRLTLCLAGGWICIFGVLCRGVKSSGKAAYFLALFPYVVMLALLIRAVTLEGSWIGIQFFITPEWSKLVDPSVWYAAITQCFFSLSVCFGPIIMYSSYNPFEHRLYRDVMIVTTLDTFTSLIAGCTIFGILGNLAHSMGTEDVSQVVRGGTGLAFISYPEALSKFTFVPQLFAVLFFLMMLVLGIGSAMALAGGPFSVICDRFPNVKQWVIMLCISVVGFLIGLMYVTPGGQWAVTLVDYFGGTFIAILVGVAEIVTIFWIYGLRRFLDDVEFMTGVRPGLYWRLCWVAVTPILMIVIMVYTIVIYTPVTYNDIEFPTSAYAIGWTIVGLTIAQLVAWMAYRLIRTGSSSFKQTLKNAFLPDEKWGPRDDKVKHEWRLFKETRKSEATSNGLYNLFFD
ncbi:sodium-dependent nutrient amino acid transporter 1-like [Athalia rosae]|uniref:sodium-dependent nutrient amino acid transporter 1-like n=1 Tax=Athalia rosae TaxID=37344 RepID=UPI00203321FC|nr:sodium-dependent nutrient amino acid transporter 1-like [Athalia rosae]